MIKTVKPLERLRGYIPHSKSSGEPEHPHQRIRCSPICNIWNRRKSPTNSHISGPIKCEPASEESLIAKQPRSRWRLRCIKCGQTWTIMHKTYGAKGPVITHGQGVGLEEFRFISFFITPPPPPENQTVFQDTPSFHLNFSKPPSPTHLAPYPCTPASKLVRWIDKTTPEPYSC